MTINTLIAMLEKLVDIAKGDTIPATIAKRLLEAEATTHNVEEIEKLISEYDRNK